LVRARGAVFDPEAVARLEAASGAIGEGDEHQVLEDPASGRIVKFTTGGRYGAQGLNHYLHDLERSNTLFETENVIEGIAIQPDGYVSIVTSQPYIRGEPATEDQIGRDLARRGFFRNGLSSYFNPDTDEIINDAAPRNVLADRDGALHYIDVSFRKAPERMVDMFTNMARSSPYWGSAVGSQPIGNFATPSRGKFGPTGSPWPQRITTRATPHVCNQFILSGAPIRIRT
jgi:Serine/Threonine/Tyrosine Kinase found in polyvalent proteins